MEFTVVQRISLYIILYQTYIYIHSIIYNMFYLIFNSTSSVLEQGFINLWLEVINRTEKEEELNKRKIL